MIFQLLFFFESVLQLSKKTAVQGCQPACISSRLSGPTSNTVLKDAYFG